MHLSPHMCGVTVFLLIYLNSQSVPAHLWPYNRVITVCCIYSYFLCFIIILFIDSFINLIQFSFSQFQDSFLSLQFSFKSLKPICFGLGLINFTILPLALVFYFYF